MPANTPTLQNARNANKSILPPNVPSNYEKIIVSSLVQNSRENGEKAGKPN